MTKSVIRQAEPGKSGPELRLQVLRHGDPLPAEAWALVEAGLAEGHAFLDQIAAFWGRDDAHYADPRACILLAWEDEAVVGIAGVTVDPYADDPATGRLKHVYVQPGSRRRGVGDALVQTAIEQARGRWRRLRLRAADQGAARLYERWGFRSAPDEPQATHVRESEAPATTGAARS